MCPQEACESLLLQPFLAQQQQHTTQRLISLADARVEEETPEMGRHCAFTGARFWADPIGAMTDIWGYAVAHAVSHGPLDGNSHGVDCLLVVGR
ncbi:MAG: hypothetical protein R2932_39235 [Caldilineaceae bacterium]